MKKRVLILLLVSIMAVSGCTSETTSVDAPKETSEEITPEVEATTEEEVVEEKEEVAEEEVEVVDEYVGMQDEEIVIRKRITENYKDTDITEITLNPDLGTEAEDDLIALVKLTWNVQNSGKTSKEMLQLYSSDLAATVAKECPNIQEIAIFWEVPYLNDNAKCSYERKEEGMYEMDMMWGTAFN